MNFGGAVPGFNSSNPGQQHTVVITEQLQHLILVCIQISFATWVSPELN